MNENGNIVIEDDEFDFYDGSGDDDDIHNKKRVNVGIQRNMDFPLSDSSSDEEFDDIDDIDNI